MTTPTLFDGFIERTNMHEAIEFTINSMKVYAAKYRHWCIAWSGGKDSTATLTLIVYLIESGQIPKPESLTVLYADTRMELIPLSISAMHIREELAERGIACEVVMADVEKRFLPYILGRGVPPPNNNTMRWCTGALKIEPMKRAAEKIRGRTGEKILMITGVRQGESAIRDGRISLSCSKNGAECGQGWFQETMPENVCDTLAPLLHWRVCHVWAWLKNWATTAEFGDWSTKVLADAYGGDEAEEVNARTGCMGCPLAQRDSALEAVCKMPKWSYLSPLLGLRTIYDEMRSPTHRLRQTGEQRLKNGSIPKNPNRMGPLTIEARQHFFGLIISIQNEVNAAAKTLNRPTIDLLNADEITYIQSCWDTNMFPKGWTGEEPSAMETFEQVFQNGSKQPNLF